MRYDFHAHTDYSDGVLSPIQLLERAHLKGIDLLAISDHDSISGIDEAKTWLASSNLPLRILPGIEISAQSDFGEIHIVGLNIDPKTPVLVALTAQQQERRWLRVEAMETKFNKIGITGVLEVLRTSCKQVVTRSHIACALVSLGYVKDNNQAFKKYIGKEGRIKVTTKWAKMEQAIAIIHQAGGLAILAHPSRYPMSNRRLRYLIEEFKIAGGDAMEVSYPSLNPDMRAWLEVQRCNNDLMASGGSDFHYPDLKWSDLGYFTKIPDDIPHVLDIVKPQI